MSRHDVPGPRPGFGPRARAALTGSRTRAVASLGIVLGLGAIGTLAAWSDSATATSGVFSTGSIDLKVNGADSYTFTSLAKTGMMPGDSVAAVLPVKNAGATSLTYTMKATSTTALLAPQLKVTILAGGSTADSKTCTGGTAISSAANTGLVSGGDTNLISSARTLTSNATENLCFQVTLDANAPTDVQNQTVSTSFAFVASNA
ncbi:SipW-dependent-type signal peptide-containing protein [Prescottella equi]